MKIFLAKNAYFMGLVTKQIVLIMQKPTFDSCVTMYYWLRLL